MQRNSVILFFVILLSSGLTTITVPFGLGVVPKSAKQTETSKDQINKTERPVGVAHATTPGAEVITSDRVYDTDRTYFIFDSTSKNGYKILEPLRFSHKSLIYFYTFTPDNWDLAVVQLVTNEPGSVVVRSYYVRIFDQTKETVTWEKQPGYSVWKHQPELGSRIYTKPRRDDQKPIEGGNYFVTRNADGDFTAIQADSATAAGLEVKGLKADADPTLAEKAVGPFSKIEAMQIVEIMSTRPIEAKPDGSEKQAGDETEPPVTFRVPLKWTKGQIDEEVLKRCGPGHKWEDKD